MRSAFSGFKVGDVGQGDVPVDGLSEYTSRKCRLKLALLLYESVLNELEKRRDRGMSQLDARAGASTLVAGMLGVTKRTVNRWIAGGVQSCNVNSDKLIKVCLNYAPSRTPELLEEDMENHRFFLECVLNGHYPRQGVVPLQKEVTP